MYHYLHSNILQYTSLDSYYTCQFHYKYYRPLPCTFQPIVHPFKAQDPSILILHRNPWMLLHYISPSFTIHQATTTSHRRWHFPCLLKRGRTLSKSSLWSPATRVKWLLMLTIVFCSSPISHRVLWWFLHMVVRMGPVRFCHQTNPPLLSRLLGWPPVRSKHSNSPTHLVCESCNAAWVCHSEETPVSCVYHMQNILETFGTR